jgi:hypothetical protein
MHAGKCCWCCSSCSNLQRAAMFCAASSSSPCSYSTIPAKDQQARSAGGQPHGAEPGNLPGNTPSPTSPGPGSSSGSGRPRARGGTHASGASTPDARCSSGSDFRSSQLQLIGMSATLPNVDQLAKWLDAVLYRTDFRPVPLVTLLKVGNTLTHTDGQVVLLTACTHMRLPCINVRLSYSTCARGTAG